MNGNPSFLLLALIGIFAGLSAGFFGIGGGIIIVPALVYLAGFSQHSAIGTSLAILLPPVGLAAVIEYHRKGHVDFRSAIIVAFFLFVFAWISSRLANRVNEPYLKLAFGIFLVLIGLYVVINSIFMIKKPV
ncbi:MAG: sulfite exporter TauE/SafE family protein [Candidatus Aureabacteria bacterium]|nr:sulfite exporter TauE/SafE family protein [Candidatus Auribacterota bacterium]